MSKELKRLKDWLVGYHDAMGKTGSVLDIDDLFDDINNFIDSLIREGEIAEHEAKKAANVGVHGLSDADKFLQAAGLI